MKGVIRIFVITLLVALLGQACIQAYWGNFGINTLDQLTQSYVQAQVQLQRLNRDLNNGMPNSSLQAQAKFLQTFIQDFSDSLAGGTIGSIINNTSYYYVLGKLNFSNNGASTALQVYVPGQASGQQENSSPADWIVVGPGQTVKVDLKLSDLMSSGYGYYGLILYTENPQGVTSYGVSSLYTKIQQGLSGSEDNSPFGAVTPDYKQEYRLAGGNLSFDFGGSSQELCISRTSDLLRRSHCITPKTLLKKFTINGKNIHTSKGYTKAPYFSSSVNNDVGQQQTVIWPVTWSIDITISNVATKMTDKTTGKVTTTNYVMPSISKFVVTGLQTFDVTKLHGQIDAFSITEKLSSYNNYVQKQFHGFTQFSGSLQTKKNKYVHYQDEHTVNIPVTQENSYGKLPAIASMSNLVIIAQALRSKPSNWSPTLWNTALQLWSDIAKTMPTMYQPIHIA